MLYRQSTAGKIPRNLNYACTRDARGIGIWVVWSLIFCLPPIVSVGLVQLEWAVWPFLSLPLDCGRAARWREMPNCVRGFGEVGMALTWLVRCHRVGVAATVFHSHILCRNCPFCGWQFPLFPAVYCGPLCTMVRCVPLYCTMALFAAGCACYSVCPIVVVVVLGFVALWCCIVASRVVASLLPRQVWCGAPLKGAWAYREAGWYPSGVSVWRCRIVIWHGCCGQPC